MTYMTIEDIAAAWEVDAKVDQTNLVEKSLEVAQVSNKYFKIFMKEKAILRKMDSELKTLKHNKRKFYQGHLDEGTEKGLGWTHLKPASGKPGTKGELEERVDFDPDVRSLVEAQALQGDKVAYLEEIISQINNRRFNISNVVKFLQWSQGQT
jgi:hypothetical protein